MSRLPLSSLLCASVLLGTSVSQAVVIPTDFTWTGTSGNSNATTPGNWTGGVAPTFNGGSENLIFPDTGSIFVNFSANADLYALNVTGHRHISGAIFLNLYGGLTFSSTYQTHLAFENNLGLNVAADQPWSIGPNSRVEFYSSAFVTGTGKITKTGAGTLDFNSINSGWSGGLQFNEGAIVLRPNSYGTGEDESRSLGTGTVTIGSDTASRPTFLVYDWTNSGNNSDEVALANNFVLNGVFSAKNQAELNLRGSVTLNADTTFRIQGDVTVIEGDVGESGGARKLTLDASSALVIAGASNWTGGTDVTKGALIFAGKSNGTSYDPNLPGGTGNILVSTNGYAGIGNANSIAAFMGKINAASTGTLGFDSDPEGLPQSFGETVTIDLSTFAASLRLGSATSAKLASTVTITPKDNNYRFGGGGGWLQVDSQLTSGRTVTLDSLSELPLTVRLTNTSNAFGSISVTNSGGVFAPGALPGSATLTVASGAYLGSEDTSFTANATAINAYLARFGASTPGIIGFDIDQLASSPTTRVVDLAGVNVGSLTGGGYLGTASALLNLTTGEITGPGVRFTASTGTIAPNSDSVHRFAAYKGGALEVAGTLGGSSMIIGHPNSLGAFGDRNREEYSTVLISGNNSGGLTGGTTLYGGRLLVGQATGDGVVGTDHTHALGEGTLNIATVSFTLEDEEGPETPAPMLAAYANNLIISNPIQLNAPELNLGGDNDFTLSGVISGSGELYVGEDSDAGFVLTLSGANTFTGGVYVSNSALIKAASDTALGTGKLAFGNSSSRVEFSTVNPVVYGLEGNVSNSEVTLINTASPRLRIIQNFDSTYMGDLRADSGTTGTYGVFVKEGTGTLRLNDVDVYGYGQGANRNVLEAKAGTLVLATTRFENTSVSVKVNGGTLALDNNMTLSNPLDFIAGRLAGHGTFASLVSLPTSAAISPGFSAGILTFSGGLSLAGGSIMDFELGSISDKILVTGGTLTGPASGTVTLNLSTISGFLAGSYTLINWSGATLSNLTAASFNIGNVPFGMQSSDFTLSVSGTTLQLFAAVPEPSTYALMALGLGLLGLTVWRKRLP